jgi:formate hydrogenlyase subunit 3/multisubunit Na+/H+ antiporter MnhD subunit
VFLAKFLILREALARGHYWLAAAYLFFLALLFAGMAKVFIAMTFGECAEKPGDRPFAEPRGMLLPAAVLFAVVLLAGLYLPGWFSGLLRDAAANVAGTL